MNKKGIILTITGPSLSGKSYLESHLVESGVVVKALSTTTRNPRAGEIQGVAYDFITGASKDADFLKLVNDGQMVEHVFFDKNYYGVKKDEIEEKFAMNRPVAIVVEPNGAQQIKQFAESQGWDCIRVFVSNPEAVLRQRFDKRQAEDKLAKPEDYAARYESMKTTELVWKKQMADAELVFDAFDEIAFPEVVKTIKNEIHNKEIAQNRKAGTSKPKP
jgi:guanylate kinase